MVHTTIDDYTSFSRRHILCLLLAIGAAKTISATNMIPQKYIIAGDYPTKSKNVRTTSLIDLDQREMERLLSLHLHCEESYWLEKARDIYENGMHSGPYALLSLTKPLDHPVDLPMVTESSYVNSIAYDMSAHPIYELSIVGGNNDSYDTTIHGFIRSENPQSIIQTKELKVIYPEGSTCMIDGRIDDCFAGPEGSAVLQGYGAIDYTYDPVTDTYLQYSLKGFSEYESLQMFYCEHHGGCDSYIEYENFFKYYGVLDYGNHWIDSAFSGVKTEFNQGNVNFSVLSNRARNAAISTATVTMNTFTMINRLMVEFAMGGCKKSVKDFSTYGDSSSTDAVIANWDQAVAIYYGSALIARENDDAVKDDRETGSLYFHLIQELAQDFGVLEESGKQSVLNRKILKEFKLGRFGLTQDDCNGQVYMSYWTIVHAMRVPWIQGVLKAAFLLSTDNDAIAISDDNFLEDERGRGAASLAALLPDLHSCSSGAAQTVYDEFEKALSGSRLDYDVIRDIIEHQYQCLTVTCDEVGGYLNPETGDYYEATRPCGGFGTMISQRPESVAYASVGSPSKSSLRRFKIGSTTSSSIFFIALVFFLLSIVVLVSVGRYNRHRVIDAYHWLSKDCSDDSDDEFEMSSQTYFQNDSVASIDDSFRL